MVNAKEGNVKKWDGSVTRVGEIGTEVDTVTKISSKSAF